MLEYTTGLIQTFLLIVAALFPIINPPGTALLFLAMTRGLKQSEREQLAKRVAIYAGIIIIASLSIGGFVLTVFGITVPVLRMAGGIVVALTGWQLLSAPPEQSMSDSVKVSRGNVAFYPLTMPLTTGPGTIAACIALGTARPGDRTGIFLFAGIAAVLGISLLIYVCFRYASTVERLLGAAGSEAFSRIFAFILFCIGIETFWLGFSAAWHELGTEVGAGQLAVPTPPLHGGVGTLLTR